MVWITCLYIILFQICKSTWLSIMPASFPCQQPIQNIYMFIPNMGPMGMIWITYFLLTLGNLETWSCDYSNYRICKYGKIFTIVLFWMSSSLDWNRANCVQDTFARETKHWKSDRLYYHVGFFLSLFLVYMHHLTKYFMAKFNSLVELAFLVFIQVLEPDTDSIYYMWEQIHLVSYWK